MSGSMIFIRANIFMSDSMINSYSGGLGSFGGGSVSGSSFHMPGLNRDLNYFLFDFTLNLFRHFRS